MDVRRRKKIRTHGNLSSGKNNSQPKIVYSKTTVNNSPSTISNSVREDSTSLYSTSATCRLRQARLKCAVHMASPAKAVAARRRSKIDQSPSLRRCVSGSKVCWLTIGHIDDLLCFSCRLRTSNQRSQRPSQAGMRLDYKNSAHSENCSVLANRIVKKISFSRSVRTSGQSAA